MKCPKEEVPKGGSAQEKIKCGNQVVEIQEERKKKIVTTKLSKMRGKKKKEKKKSGILLFNTHFGRPLHRISKKCWQGQKNSP